MNLRTIPRPIGVPVHSPSLLRHLDQVFKRQSIPPPRIHEPVEFKKALAEHREYMKRTPKEEKFAAMRERMERLKT